MKTTAEPADPDAPAPETRVRVSVPEEFLAMAISEVTARDGRVTDMKMTSGGAVIVATLPSSEVEGLSQDISAATLNRGNVESDPV